MLRLSRRALLRGGGALAATKLLAPAKAGFVLGKAGGGGGGYVAKAVHFDGIANTTLDSTTFLNSVDAPVVVKSVWVLLAAGTVAGGYNLFDWSGRNADVTFSMNNATSGPQTSYNGFASEITNDANGVPTEEIWQHWLGKLNAQAQTVQFYLSDINKSLPVFVTGAAGNIPFSAGYSAGFPEQQSSGYAPTIDAADFQMFILQDDFDLSIEANRQLFISASGKPVNPAIASAALGTPSILFSGDADTFATNQGAGGPFTLTGTLTNASTSPSD